MHEVRDQGRVIRSFSGSPRAWLDDFAAPKRRLVRINTMTSEAHCRAILAEIETTAAYGRSRRLFNDDAIQAFADWWAALPPGVDSGVHSEGIELIAADDISDAMVRALRRKYAVAAGQGWKILAERDGCDPLWPHPDGLPMPLSSLWTGLVIHRALSPTDV
jgi:hypothetical protein